MSTKAIREGPTGLAARAAGGLFCPQTTGSQTKAPHSPAARVSVITSFFTFGELREGTRMWPNAGRRQSDSRCAGVLAGIGLFGRERELRGGYMADIEMSVNRETREKWTTLITKHRFNHEKPSAACGRNQVNLTADYAD